MKRVSLAALAALTLVLSGCGALAPNSASEPVVDTPVLKALKAAAHMPDCPPSSAPATGGLPKATLPCLGGGRSVALASLRGPMVINVWATWCAQCQLEMPHIEAFAKKYAGRVSVLGVDWEDQPQEALEFARSKGATYPMITDSDPDASPAPVFRTAALPVTILVNAAGRIAYEQPVAITSLAELQQLVQQHLGVKP